jgi:hypothetical protein
MPDASKPDNTRTSRRVMDRAQSRTATVSRRITRRKKAGTADLDKAMKKVVKTAGRVALQATTEPFRMIERANLGLKKKKKKRSRRIKRKK